MTEPIVTDALREAFEQWVKKSGSFTDWSRFEDGYAKPLVDRTWRAWCAATEAALAAAPAAPPSDGNSILNDLRQWQHDARVDRLVRNIAGDAADEIERLRATLQTDSLGKSAVEIDGPASDEFTQIVSDWAEAGFKRGFVTGWHIEELHTALRALDPPVDALARVREALKFDESAANQAAVVHTAFRHTGNSGHADRAWHAINEMKPEEWVAIVDYATHWLRKNINDLRAALRALDVPQKAPRSQLRPHFPADAGENEKMEDGALDAKREGG